jgi:Protein of unknown function (DUF4232)
MISLRIVSALALLALLAPAPGRPAASHIVAPVCGANQLRIALRHLGAALGTVGGYLSFRNVSGTPCRISGWPTLVAYTAAGKATVAVRRHSTMFGPDVRGVPVVTLRRGERAEAVFTGSDVNARSATRLCPSFRFFRVGLPGQSATVRVSAWITGLGAYMPNCSGIWVSMIVPARSLYRG